MVIVSWIMCACVLIPCFIMDLDVINVGGYVFPFILLAVCNPGCRNGGVCVAPQTCNCTSQFNGTICQSQISTTASSTTGNFNTGNFTTGAVIMSGTSASTTGPRGPVFGLGNIPNSNVSYDW